MFNINQRNWPIWPNNDDARRFIGGKTKDIAKISIKRDKAAIFSETLFINDRIGCARKVFIKNRMGIKILRLEK